MSIILQAWWLPIINPILGVIGAALAGLLGTLIFKLSAWIGKKTKNEQYVAALEEIAEIAHNVVLTINQTFVDDLKKKGKFDKQSQKEAFEKSFAMLKNMIPEKTMEIINKHFGSTEGFLRTIIESTVAMINN